MKALNQRHHEISLSEQPNVSEQTTKQFRQRRIEYTTDRKSKEEVMLVETRIAKGRNKQRTNKQESIEADPRTDDDNNDRDKTIRRFQLLRDEEMMNMVICEYACLWVILTLSTSSSIA